MLRTGAVFLFIFAGRPARAQVAAPKTDIESQIAEPQRKRKAALEAEKAAQEGKKREAEGGAEATYEQVLASPDNIDLNFRYARSSVEKGDLRAAASTLERILMVNPNLPKVRLFYAIVLFRLDNLDDAEREIATLKKETMPESLRGEIEQYAKEIRKRRSTDRFSVQIGAGVDFDENRNSAPSSKQRLVADVPFDLNSASTRQNDLAKTMLLGVGWTHNLPFQGGHQVFADAGYYRSEQTNQRSLDLQNYSVDAGLALKSSRFFDLTPSFEFNHLILAQTTYLRSQAGKVLLSRKLSQRIEAFGQASYTSQLYSRTRIVTNGNQFSGERIEGGLGASVTLTPSQSLSVAYAHANQGAGIGKFNAYTRESWTLGHNWLLGRGQFLLSSLTFNYDAYEAADPVVSTKVRADDTIRLRGTYGVPLSFFHKRLPGAMLTFTYEYYHALSNITNYAYTNNKLSTFLSYKWEFGLR